MKISVIMSVYNGEEHLQKAISAVLNQTFKDFEFLIIDDGSTDNSYKIMRKFADKDKRIRLIRNRKNIGLTKSLNNAIMQSNGEYIARQDVDDISMPNRFQIQLNFLENNSDYTLCGTDVIVKQDINKSVGINEINDIRKNLIVSNYFVHSSVIMRKKILMKIGFYDENWLYGQDYELWCRFIYKYKLKARILNEKLVIMDRPVKRLHQRDLKFVLQHLNYVKTRVKYIKYCNRFMIIIRSIFSIVRNISEILYIIGFQILSFKTLDFNHLTKFML